MSYMDKYMEWIEKADEETVDELLDIKDNENEIEDRFYKSLEFGTAGLRGIMGAGTNRMNKYVLMQATKALAEVILEEGGADKGVAIAHDCRINSRVYAETCAAIFYSKGIKTYIFEELRPTPELSYAIRALGTMSGVNITASHNPQAYNGYKVYWNEGAQILDEIAGRILNKIKEIELFDSEGIPSFEEGVKSGAITLLGEEMDRKFLDEVKKLALNEEGIDKSVSAVYTPLNGTGATMVPRILKERGFENIICVDEQMEPDGRFPTTPYPNPEDTSTFDIAVGYAKEHESELCVATDPDADRIAIMVRGKDNEYIPMNGNQTGALLVNYVLSQMNEKGLLEPKDALVTTIVTGDLGEAIADKYGLKTYRTLTGFKHVCGKANEFEKTGEARYVFGYEESIGYCPGTFVRDKDAVSTAMLLFEMAAYYKAKGKSLLQVMDEIYEEHGHYRESQFSIVYKGVDGAELKEKVIDGWRDGYPTDVGGEKLVSVTDYLVSEHTELATKEKSPVDIPESDVMKFRFDCGTWYALRPSGTEPKLKIYIYTVKDSEEKALEALQAFESELKIKINEIEKS